MSASGECRELMMLAVNSAREGLTKREGGPFGATIVKDGKVVAVAHNTVVRDQDPSCHAEMNCIRAACKELGTHDLSGCVLYATGRPCPLCRGGIFLSGIRQVMYASTYETAAELGFDDSEFFRQLDLPESERAVCTRGGIDKEVVKKELFEGLGKGKSESDLISLCVEDPIMGDALFSALTDITRKPMGGGGYSTPSGAIVVKDNKVISAGACSAVGDKDCTATAVVNAIRAATHKLKTRNLHGCEIVTTTEPDLMSVGCICWARISGLRYSVSLKEAKSYGYGDEATAFEDLVKPDADRMLKEVYVPFPAECNELFDIFRKDPIIY